MSAYGARIAQIVIAWLVALVLFAGPVAVIASCDPAPAVQATTTIDGPLDAIAWHAASDEAPSQCEWVRPFELDDALTPAQRLPDDAIIATLGGADRFVVEARAEPLAERSVGRSPPPESPPPRSISAR